MIAPLGSLSPVIRWEDFRHYDSGVSLAAYKVSPAPANVCPTCHGRGRWWDDTYGVITCADCEGTGVL